MTVSDQPPEEFQNLYLSTYAPVKGTSTLYDSKTGEPKIQWVKTQADKESQLLAMQEALLETFSNVQPLPAIRSPKHSNKDLLSVIPMGDPHIGMYAWKDEAGEDFDTDIASKDLKEAVDQDVRAIFVLGRG